MEPICLFPVSGIILRTCFRLFADSDVAFVFLADKLARFCHHIGKALPKALQNAGITSKNGRNDAKRLNINVVTVTNDDKMKKRKTQ